MARTLGITISGDYNSTAIKEATAGVETFGRTVNETATKNIERLAAQRVKLRELAGEYQALAASSERGSAQQVAALDLAAKAQKRLGTETLATNAVIRTSARDTAASVALSEREIGKFARGAGSASGGFGRTAALSLGSGGFLFGAGLAMGAKDAISAAKELMGAREQLAVAAHNVGVSLNAKQIDAYLAAESKLSLFTKAELTASLVGLVRATGDVSKAQTDASLAANIARATGKDLADVTQGLINLEGGRTRSLVALGVKIPIVKTATDALTASGLKFTGQQRAEAAALDRAATAAEGKRILLQRYHDASETYAKSEAASADKLRVAENTLATSIGTVLLPVVKTIADPFAKWAQKEADSGDAAKKTKEIVGDLTAVLRDAKGVIKGVDDVTGGFKHTLELLIGLKVAATMSAWIKGLGAFKVAAGEAAAPLLAIAKLLGPATFAAFDKVANGGAPIPGAVKDSHGVWVDPKTGHYIAKSPNGPMDMGPDPNWVPGTGKTGTKGADPGVAAVTGAHSGSGKQKMLALAESMIGTPYLWGGAGPGGFDCSGLVSWAFANGLHINVPHSTYAQAKMGSLIGSNSLKGAKAGDILFTQYGEGGKAGPGHEGIYLGGGMVLSAPHTGAKVGISSLKGFTGGGAFTVRDLLGTAGGGGNDPAAAAALAAILAGGKKKASVLRGAGLISGSLLDKITGDKNSATDSSGSVAAMWLHREHADLERARAEVAAKLKSASPKQKTAIEAELRTIDTKIASVNKSITTNLKEQASAIKANAKAAITAAKQNIASAFGQIITDARSAFEKETQDYIDNVLSAKYLQGTDTHGNKLQTASEKKLADMQAADTATQLQDALTAAKQQLTDDTTGALLEHVVDITTGATKDIFGPAGTSQQKSLDQKAIDAAQRALDENTIAIDAAKERAQEDYDYAQAVKDYQQERSLAESAMVEGLKTFEKELENGKASVGDLSGILKGFGIDISDIPSDQWKSDFADLGDATIALSQVMIDRANALNAAGAPGASPIPYVHSPGIAPTGGNDAYVRDAGKLVGKIIALDSGADILRDGFAYVHAGERVQSAEVVRGGGGGGGGHTFIIQAPNYVGSHDDLVAAIKSPAVVEAVSTAVLVGNRRGHIRANQLT